MPRRRQRGRAWARVALAINAVVLVAAPVLHDDGDLASHLRAPAHCSLCQTLPALTLPPEPPPVQRLSALPEWVDSPAPEPGEVYAGFRLSGRAPPR